MKFEIHVTTKTIELPEFYSKLGSLDIKPAVLTLSSGEIHQMTSEICREFDDYKFIEDQLTSVGLEIIRTKIEIKPSIRYESLYYEAHFDGFIPCYPYAVNICKQTPIISSTVRKPSLRELEFCVETCRFMTRLPHPDLEQCVYDTNPELDALWMQGILKPS